MAIASSVHRDAGRRRAVARRTQPAAPRQLRPAPSGQAIAERMGVAKLSVEQLADLLSYDMAESTPLWFYILREAEVRESGTRLGPVGARIVGEVFVGLLKADRHAYLAANPGGRPCRQRAARGVFRITDLLRLAGRRGAA